MRKPSICGKLAPDNKKVVSGSIAPPGSAGVKSDHVDCDLGEKEEKVQTRDGEKDLGCQHLLLSYSVLSHRAAHLIEPPRPNATPVGVHVVKSPREQSSIDEQQPQ